MFCKDFNDRTSNIKPGVPIPVTLIVNVSSKNKKWYSTE